MKFKVAYLNNEVKFSFQSHKIQIDENSYVQDSQQIMKTFAFRLQRRKIDNTSGIIENGIRFSTNEYLQQNNAIGLMKTGYFYFDTSRKLILYYNLSKENALKFLRDYFTVDKQFVQFEVDYEKLAIISAIKFEKVPRYQLSLFNEDDDIEIVNKKIDDIFENDKPTAMEVVLKYNDATSFNSKKLEKMINNVKASENSKMIVVGADDQGNQLDNTSGIFQRTIDVFENINDYKEKESLKLDDIWNELQTKL